MNTNFIGQPDSCVGYIKRKSSEKLTNQQLADNFMGSYSKKYCGDKDFIKSLLEAYPDSKNFQEKKSVTMDPRLLVVTNSDINLIMESLSKSINHSNIRRHTLSSVAINDLWVYFGFIITEHLEQEIYF